MPRTAIPPCCATCCWRGFDQEPGNFRILESNNLYFARMLAAEFPKIDVAAAYQHVLEVVATAYVAHYLQQTGLRNLVLSGGVVANVKLNQRLRELPGVEGIFVHPNMGDGGCGTGAALLEFVGNKALTEPLPDVFLGPGLQRRPDRRRAEPGAASVRSLSGDRGQDRSVGTWLEPLMKNRPRTGCSHTALA